MNINQHNEDNNIKNSDLTTREQKMIAQANNISNKEALKDKIHDIHNYMRNNGIGYGMNALKTFNFLYGMKKIEECGLLDKVDVNVPPDCRFSYLLQLANENNGETIMVVLRKMLNYYYGNGNNKSKWNVIFHVIPFNVKGSVYVFLIQEIDKITAIEKTCNVLLSGKIYEYFIGRDESAISELGAYFTDRHIVEYILDRLNPVLNEDGSVPTMVDMFGGSGGFTTGYIHYIKEKYKTAGTEIDWEKEIHNISHYDMNEDVLKSAGLEIFCLTGVLPVMEKNIKYKNSFTDEFEDKKYKYILTNPPYGGDKSNKTETQNKRDKVKEYIKKELLGLKEKADEDEEGAVGILREKRHLQLAKIEADEKREKKEIDKNKVCMSSCSARIQKFAYNNGKLKGNDKESCSLVLLMDTVEVGGTVVGVLKEGVFFNKTYKDLRRVLIEKYKVREVISVPQDQFENTSTKTSILIFDNTASDEDKTQEIIFKELVVEKYEEDVFVEIAGELVVAENKGDIRGLKDMVISRASREELLGNSIYSLNGKDYVKKDVVVVGEEYEMVKLGDMCDIRLGTRITKENNTIGDIPVYGGGDITLYTNTSNRDKNTLIISRYAMSKKCVRLIPNEFYLNDSGMSIHSKNQQLQEYLNFFLLNVVYQEHIYVNCTSGSIQRNINMNLFKNITLPIPKNPEKIQEWVNRINIPYNTIIENEIRVKELERTIKDRIKEIEETEEMEEVELKNVCEYIKTGKNKTPDNKQGTLYPYYGTGNITGYTDHYLFDGKHILVARNGTMGNCFLVNEKIYPSDHIFVIKNNKDEINIEYLFYIIKGLSQEIQNKSNGSVIKGISKENLSKIKIRLPKDKEIIENLNPLFVEIEQLQRDIKENDILYKKYIQELSEEAIPTNHNK